MTNKDYSNSRFYAISGVGYGKGDTPEEAVENYIRIQLRNHPAKNTVFKTKAKWTEALTSGEAKATVWEAPEGTTGFVLDSQIYWQDAAGKTTSAKAEEERYIRLDLKIENIYEDGDKVVTKPTTWVPFPPTDKDSDAYQDWEVEQICAATGTGREDGDAAYFVEVVTSDVEEIIAVGTEYEFGL